MKSKILHVAHGPRRFLWLVPLAWAGVLFFASSLPGTSYPQVSFAYADKIVHVAVYGVFGGLLAWAARSNFAWSKAGVWGFATAVATLYGGTDEVHQMFVPNRSPDVRDLLADGLGAALGAAVAMLLISVLSARKKRDV